VHRLVILGGGESGVGSAILGKKEGYEVFLSDAGSLKENYKTELKSHGIVFEEGQHSAEKILQADEVMKSPGIPEKNEMVKSIRKKGMPVISEIELAFRFKGTAKIIAITGSNGKTTTTALCYHMCR
jgi:UDP-N-acetylmuramoylalanine--D-glutamate ligase